MLIILENKYSVNAGMIRSLMKLFFIFQSLRRASVSAESLKLVVSDSVILDSG